MKTQQHFKYSALRFLAPTFGPFSSRCLMPAATSPSTSPRPSSISKMEDRKRPAIGGADDFAPPSKRVAVNGSKAKDDAPEMKEESWIDVSVARHPVLSHREPRRLRVTSNCHSSAPPDTGLCVCPVRRPYGFGQRVLYP